MEVWQILLSGTVGAVVATFLLVWYQHVFEQIKNRKYIIITVTEWIDNIYTRLQLLCACKEQLFEHQQKSMSNREYRSMINEMRILLLSNKIIMEVACVYGEGNIFQKISELRNSMTTAASIFFNARQETWADSHAEIMRLFNENIDPTRASITDDFFHSLREFSILVMLKIKKP